MKDAGEHIRLILHRVSQQPAFVPHPENPAAMRNAVDLGTFFERQALLYAALPAQLGSTICCELADLLTKAITTAGTIARERKCKVILFVDEIQQMVAAGLDVALLLRQARSLGISLIASNQTVSDLILPQVNLQATFEGNTAVQAWFKVSDTLGMEQLRRLGGRKLIYLHSTSSQSGPEARSTTTSQEVLVDRFATDEVAFAASHKDVFILRVTNNSGYAQYDCLPFYVRHEHPISFQEYRRRLLAPWPRRRPTRLSSHTPTMVPALHRPRHPPRRYRCPARGQMARVTAARRAAAATYDEEHRCPKHSPDWPGRLAMTMTMTRAEFFSPPPTGTNCGYLRTVGQPSPGDLWPLE